MRVDHLKHLFLPLLVFFVLGLVWESLSRLGGWRREILPSPLQVAASMWELIANGTLFKHTVASLFRVTLGYYLSVLLALPLGIILGWWRAGQVVFNSLIQFLRPISPLAWIPLTMLWFGIGDKPAIFLIFLSSFFPLLVSTMVSVSRINPTYFRVAANFNLSKVEAVIKIIFPAILPSILPALRISMGIAWLVVVAAEMIAVKSGLGYLILDSRNALRMDYVMGSMVMIGIIGIGLDRIISQLNKIESVSWGVHYG